MFLDILKQNNDGTLVKNKSGIPIVISLVNLDHIARIYVTQSEFPGSSSDNYYVIAVLPGTIEQHRNTIEDATNKKVIFRGSQASCEEYLYILTQDLRRRQLTLKSPAIRMDITPDKADN